MLARPLRPPVKGQLPTLHCVLPFCSNSSQSQLIPFALYTFSELEKWLHSRKKKKVAKMPIFWKFLFFKTCSLILFWIQGFIKWNLEKKSIVMGYGFDDWWLYPLWKWGQDGRSTPMAFKDFHPHIFASTKVVCTTSSQKISYTKEKVVHHCRFFLPEREEKQK